MYKNEPNEVEVEVEVEVLVIVVVFVRLILYGCYYNVDDADDDDDDDDDDDYPDGFNFTELIIEIVHRSLKIKACAKGRRNAPSISPNNSAAKRKNNRDLLNKTTITINEHINGLTSKHFQCLHITYAPLQRR
uniref:Uncharacterized protein n=1 Tax=Glossina austeni TaxID=7395 RepID=A0A1A9URG0_GLOAU